MSTTLIDLGGPQSANQPEPKRKRSWRVPAALALLVALLVTSVVYGYTQHTHGVAVTAQRNVAQHTLVDTRKALASTKSDLSSTQSDLESAQSDLSDAQDQLGTCADVSKATMELFNSSESLLQAIQSWPDSMGDLDAASGNIDKVGALIDANGFDNIQDFLAACKGTGGGSGSSI